MSYFLDATYNFFKTIDDVKVLIEFARTENNEGRIQHHDLFLNLSVVSLVTKFQVFVENSLEEFLYQIQISNKNYQDLPLHLRLSSLKYLLNNSDILPNKLEHPQKYNQQIMQQVKSELEKFYQICVDEAKINNNFKFNTQFPMGKQGVNELIDLYKQINGENIFELSSFDKNKLNEILRRRHDIIHDDVSHQLTERKVTEYKNFIIEVVEYIDNYLKVQAC